MPFTGVFTADLAPVYVDLDTALGAYLIEPGEDPIIALNITLKDKNDPAANIVYQALVAFHNSLPDVYRLFPLEVLYEDLPQTALPAPPEIIFLGKARKQRYFRCEVVERGRYRVIGRAVS